MEIKSLLNPQQIRQGDVVITPCLVPPCSEHIGELLIDSERKRTVLAYGEATGHAHAFYEQDSTHPARVELYTFTNPNQLYAKTTFTDVELLRICERSLLRHEEHYFISIPPGDYVIVHQCEYDDIEELRRVAD